jgi:cell cycle arrest protein BUB3
MSNDKLNGVQICVYQTMSSVEVPEAQSLPDPPLGGITALRYLPDQPVLLASSSWDGAVRVHDTSERQRVLQHFMQSGPLLSLATLTDGRLVTGGLDGSVRLLSLASSVVTPVGQNQCLPNLPPDKIACSCLGTVPALGHDVVASAGWHRQFHLYDVRQRSATTTSVTLPGKAFGLDIDPLRPRAVVCTSGRRIVVIDFRRTDETFAAEIALDRESSLKYQTSTIRFFPDGTGLALGSVEGRVGIEYLEELDVVPPPNSKKYAFKCHRNGDLVYPVNCIDFHPQYGTFATGGSDNTVGMYTIHSFTCTRRIASHPPHVLFSHLGRSSQEKSGVHCFLSYFRLGLGVQSRRLRASDCQ